MAEQNKKSTFRAFASQAKNDNFTTRGFSPLIERVLAGVGNDKIARVYEKPTGTSLISKAERARDWNLKSTIKIFLPECDHRKRHYH